MIPSDIKKFTNYCIKIRNNYIIISVLFFIKIFCMEKGVYFFICLFLSQ